MPVSSSSSRCAVAARSSSCSRLPVTDCQCSGKSARSSNSTWRSAVWTSTRTETGCLYATAITVPVATPSTDQHPERAVALAPERGRFGQYFLERSPVVRMRLAVVRGVSEPDRASGLADPVPIFERVGERVEVVAEVLGQLEALREFMEQRRLVLGVREIDAEIAQFGVARGGGDRVRMPVVFEHARFVEATEIG